MRHFTPGELERLRITQEGAMQDVCVRLAYSAGAVDDYGQPAPTWTQEGAMICGFRPNSRREVMDGTQVVIADAELRLPVEAEVDARDRFDITHRYGEAVPIERYEVLGTPQRGPSGLRLMLGRVTDGS